MKSIASVVIAVLVLVLPARTPEAAIVPFNLVGNAGTGLLPGNENPPTTGGSGGIGPGGISFDTNTNILSIDILWGSGNGFTDLTGPVTVAHIHGFTPSPPPVGFSQNAGVLYPLHTLSGFNVSATNGGFNGTVAVAPGDVAGLLAGQTYINIHTALNPGGEIRGQLTAVPVPAAVWLFVSGIVGLIGIARRTRVA